MAKSSNDNPERRRAFLMQDSVVEYPELWAEVYIAGDKFEERNFAQFFVRGACTRATSPDDADLVVFTGGVDVNPALYGEEPHSRTFFDEKRDAEDIELWNHCVANGIPMMGVCRGAQFGHVMKGGKLYQHVDGHTGDHSLWDTKDHYMVEKISSVHHQMVMPGPKDLEILGDSKVSTVKWLNNKQKAENFGYDIEAFFYRDVCFFGVQGHPEYRGYSRFAKWTLDKLYDLVVCNPDLALINNVRRIKPELRVGSEANKTLKELV